MAELTPYQKYVRTCGMTNNEPLSEERFAKVCQDTLKKRNAEPPRKTPTPPPPSVLTQPAPGASKLTHEQALDARIHAMLNGIPFDPFELDRTRSESDLKGCYRRPHD